MTATVISFPVQKPVVFIDPVENDGGCWGIFRQERGHAPTLVTTRFAFDAAEALAREMAAKIGGDYLTDTAPDPKGAA